MKKMPDNAVFAFIRQEALRFPVLPVGFAATRASGSFTLTEVLVAAVLSILVVAMVLTLLVKNLSGWGDSMARLQLSADSRIVRERLLHGINGQFGLRHARRSQLAFATDQILFHDIASSNAIILILASNQPPAWLDYTGTNHIVRDGAFVEKIVLATNGNMMNIDLTLALISKGKKYAQPQQIRVYLLNE